MDNNDVVPGFDEDTCDSLAIELQRVQEVSKGLVLKLRGQIDTYSAPFFQKSLKKAIDAGFVHLILLLYGVDYLSSKAVGTLIQVRQAALDRKGGVLLVDVHPKVLEIFQLLNLTKFFPYTDSLDQAIAQIKSHEINAVFPKSIRCPICQMKLSALQPGRFRCPECATVLVIDESGVASLC